MTLGIAAVAGQLVGGALIGPIPPGWAGACSLVNHPVGLVALGRPRRTVPESRAAGATRLSGGEGRKRSGAVSSVASVVAGGSAAGQRRVVAGGLDGGDELLGRDGARVELDGRALQRVVDRRIDAVELVA